MYLKDNFLEADSELLKDLKNKQPWEDLGDLPTSCLWDGTGEVDNIWKKLILKMWEPLFKSKDFGCFEYWVNITSADNPLGWHQDKDEIEYAKSGKTICPSTSTVFYGHPHKITGGLLEIQEATESRHPETERILPIYNRIVVFKPSRFHRVSPITEGVRYGFQVNIWDSIPEGALPFMEGENHE